MAWETSAWRWLAQAAVAGLIVLGLGSLAVRLCRQPVRRARLVVLTLVGALIVPWLGPVPCAPRWSLGVFPAAREVSQPVRADNPGTRVAASGPGERQAVAAPAAAKLLAAGPAAPHAFSWHVAIIAAYIAGAASLAAWWLTGQVLLVRLTRAARPAPAAVIGRFRAISSPAGARVRVLMSERIAVPLTFTWSRPVILLPARLCGDGKAAALQYALAHEWAHIERRDSLAWNLASVAGFVLFYQPLFWWLRRQLRLCQDYLADDRAAALGSAEDYAEHLIGLASIATRLPTLGITDGGSNLARRVVMLVQRRAPLEHRCRTLWSLAAVSAAAAAILIAAGLRLGAEIPEPEQTSKVPIAAAPEPPPWPATEPDEDGSLTYSGKVADSDTGKPVAGAVVIVKRSLFFPSHPRDDRELGRTRHTTDAGGVYTFSIPAEQVAEKDLYLAVDVEHPAYAPLPFRGYPLVAIRDDERKGLRPFFAVVAVRPGAPISGRVIAPGGEPAAGVEIRAGSRAEKLRPGDADYAYGPFSETTTGPDGSFRLMVTTPGPAVFWVLPKGFAPEDHLLIDGRRGDLGTFRLKPGVTVPGRVVDASGQALAGILVEATRDLNAPEIEALSRLSVGDLIRRKATTGTDGRFTLDPLPAGSYALQPITFEAISPTLEIPRPLPAVFRPQKFVLRAGQTAAAVELRGAAHRVIAAQFFDSKGKPFVDQNSVLTFSGEVDGQWWSTQATASDDGKIVIHVPRAMENAQFDLMPGRQATALRWRIGRSGPYLSSRFHRFGALDQDVRDLEIIHYAAPVLTVKATDEGGRPVKDLVVSARFTTPEPEPDTSYILKGGVNSDVLFQEQRDGRLRSTSLQPGRELLVTAQAAGFAPASQKLTLAEREHLEVKLVLKPE
jgi:beta-lactamase regulating signal transducer with metallopeptidase domain